MDRRQRKTREAIFKAFIELLAQKNVSKITVGEIIERADVGRATFYSHFETKDFLIKELCEELFCHVFDSVSDEECSHKHIFECEPPASAFQHLCQHLKKNDNEILKLLSCPNNEIFLKYFKNGLLKLIDAQFEMFYKGKAREISEEFWLNHVATTFVETVKWWIENKMRQTSEEITRYFLIAAGVEKE